MKVIQLSVLICILLLNSTLLSAKKSIDFTLTEGGTQPGNTMVSHPTPPSPRDIEDMTIGTGYIPLNFPICVQHRFSLFQTLYTAAELGTPKAINQISFHLNTSINVPQLTTRIWMGTTLQSELNPGWIPWQTLSQVYEGVLNVSAGQTILPIVLDSMYVYNGDNLVLMIESVCSSLTGYTGTFSFFSQPGNPGASRGVSANYRTDLNYPPTSIYNNDEIVLLTHLYPRITLSYEGHGSAVSGTVLNPGSIPIPGVDLTIDGTNLISTTDNAGQFNFPFVPMGNHILRTHCTGFEDEQFNLSVSNGAPLFQTITLESVPTVTIQGRITDAIDTDNGLTNITIDLQGYQNYRVFSDEDGYFSLDNVYTGRTYQITYAGLGFEMITGVLNVLQQNMNLGEIALQQIIGEPRNITATIVNSDVRINWQRPDFQSGVLSESFEGTLFPPAGWFRIVTNYHHSNSTEGTINTTWHRNNPTQTGWIPPVTPSDGAWQAVVGWCNSWRSDEWLITPKLYCLDGAHLIFDTNVRYGPCLDNHYAVRVSTDNGGNWDTLWDAALLPEGMNEYDAPIHIDLSAYAGMEVKLAWRADSGIEEVPGIARSWYIDNVHFNYMTQALNQRNLLGYKIWRMQDGWQNSPGSWTLLTPDPINTVEFTDTTWIQQELNWNDCWAVQACYSGGQFSPIVFSNAVYPIWYGLFTGRVTDPQNLPLANVSVTIDSLFTHTNTEGIYRIFMRPGSYNPTWHLEGYQDTTAVGILIRLGYQTINDVIMQPVAGTEESGATPLVQLLSCYPNPFYGVSFIEIQTKQTDYASLQVYNIKGQLVKTVHKGALTAGKRQFSWDGTTVNETRAAAGIYWIKLETNEGRTTRKILLLK